MDPLDREKDWAAYQQIAVITVVIGLVYGVLHFAVVIPDWGWRLIGAATVAGVAIYYFLAFRRGAKVAESQPRRSSKAHIVTVALLIGALTLPVFVVLYFLWIGGQLWK